MESATALKSEIRELSTKALRIMNDTSLSPGQRRDQLAGINAGIEHANNRLKSVEGSGFDPSTLGELHPFAPGYLPKQMKAMGMGSPSLDLPSEAYEQLFDAASSRKGLTLTDVDLKTVDSSGAPMSTIPHYTLPPVPFSREHTRVLDLIPAGATSSVKETYYTTTTGASAASTVAEGSTKPQSTLVYTAVDAPVRKIAHWIEVTDEALMDFPAFQSIVANEMSAGVIAAENHQLVLGSGSGADLTGILNFAGIQTRAKSSDTRLDALAKAITDLRVGTAYVEADGIVMHPNDWLDTVLEKSSTLEYLATNPLSDPSRKLWGLPVTLTTDITEGTAIVASFAEACRAWVREGLRLEVNPWAEAQFKANKVLILAEERIAFGVLRPQAIIKVTGL